MFHLVVVPLRHQTEYVNPMTLRVCSNVDGESSAACMQRDSVCVCVGGGGGGGGGGSDVLQLPTHTMSC